MLAFFASMSRHYAAGKKFMTLEKFKFAVYLSIPVLCVGVFNRPENLGPIIKKLNYVEFPKEAERPPTGGLDELNAYKPTGDDAAKA